MRNPIYNDDFENYLQQKAEQHRMYPADQVWRNIQEQLHGKKQWPGLAFITICIISALVVATLILTPTDAVLMSGNNLQQTPKPALLKVQGPLLESLSPGLITQETIARAKQNTTSFQSGSVFNSNSDEPGNVNVNTTPPEQEAIVSKDANLLAKNTSLVPSTTVAIPQSSALQAAANVENNLVAAQEELQSVSKTPAEEEITTVNMGKRATIEDATQAALMSAPPIVAPRKASRFEYQLYVTPSASYRRLVDEKNKEQLNYFAPVAIVSNSDVNKVVSQSPGIGIEVGMAVGYKINPQFTVRAGLQYNSRQYNIASYGINYEPAFIIFNGRNERVLNTYPIAPSIKSNYVTTLKNQTSEISVPLGIDWKATPNKKFSFGVTAAIQPTYSMFNTSYILTTDYKNYADGSALARKWNLNTSFETYISYQLGDYRWQIGPQFRYQQLSSLNTTYPIREYLLDYGIKIGVTKSIW